MKRLLLLLGIAILSMQVGTAAAGTNAVASNVGDDSVLGVKIAQADFDGSVLSGGNRNSVLCDYPGYIKAVDQRAVQADAGGELRSGF